ncbi:MAG: VOC family protein [Verrucomicrobiales bacterium]
MSEENSKEDKTPGKICWHELITKDTEGSKAFYSALFGWTIEEMDMGPMKYTMFKNGDDPQAGMIQITDEMGDVPPHWLTYVTVEDIAASVAKAKELGANVCKDVTELPMGKFAIVVDPGGAGFALWEYGECDGE